MLKSILKNAVAVLGSDIITLLKPILKEVGYVLYGINDSHNEIKETLYIIRKK